MCVAKKTSVEEPNQQPIYDDIKPYHEEILVEGNAAYGHVIQYHTKLSWYYMIGSILQKGGIQYVSEQSAKKLHTLNSHRILHHWISY